MSLKLSQLSPLMLILALLFLFPGCSRQQEQRSVDLTVPVTVQPVVLGTIEATVKATGTLRPVREAALFSEIKGTLRFGELKGGQRPVEGVPVSEGQTVVRLENEKWVVGARLESRKLALETAKKTLKEQEVLIQRGLITSKEFEDARRNRVDAEANYEDARIKIEKTRIRAPISGHLTGLTDATEGTLINQNTLIGTLMDYSQVLVDLKIPNSQIQAVSLNQPVRVRNYALPKQVFKGQVTGVNPALDATTRTFHVVCTIQNSDLRLRPGMFVEAEVVTESREDVVLISRSLVLTRQNRKVVFVEQESRAQMRNIEIGLEDGEIVEVVDGLEEGERLITSNYETLRSRTRVRVTSEESRKQTRR